MKITLSILKADVGSIGGHTKPSQRMMDAVRADAADAVKRGLLIDTFVGHTGDDICIITSHTHGPTTLRYTSLLGVPFFMPRTSPVSTDCMAQAKICWWMPPRVTSGVQDRRWRKWSSTTIRSRPTE